MTGAAVDGKGRVAPEGGVGVRAATAPEVASPRASLHRGVPAVRAQANRRGGSSWPTRSGCRLHLEHVALARILEAHVHATLVEGEARPARRPPGELRPSRYTASGASQPRTTTRIGRGAKCEVAFPPGQLEPEPAAGPVPQPQRRSEPGLAVAVRGGLAVVLDPVGGAVGARPPPRGCTAPPAVGRRGGRGCGSGPERRRAGTGAAARGARRRAAAAGPRTLRRLPTRASARAAGRPPALGRRGWITGATSREGPSISWSSTPAQSGRVGKIPVERPPDRGRPVSSASRKRP